jgi:hypothetical protein
MCFFTYTRVLRRGIKVKELSRITELLRPPTPYALSNRAIQKHWVPPHTISAVPRSIHAKIPERFRYWTFGDTSERRAVRDQMVTEIKKKLKSKRRVSRRSTG